MYQFGVMAIRWLGLEAEDWNIVLAQAPSRGWAALNVASAIAVLAVVSAVAFARREYRVKTPEAP